MSSVPSKPSLHQFARTATRLLLPILAMFGCLAPVLATESQCHVAFFQLVQGDAYSHHDVETQLREAAERKRNERDRARAIQTGQHYSPRYTLEERVSAIRQGRYAAWISERFPILYLELTAMVSRIEPRSSSVAFDEPAPREPSQLNRIATRAVEFVIETYRERRPHWTPEFLAKLQKIAIEWLPQSTYITIEKGIGWNEREIIGTLRLIGERDGKTPMENYLGIFIDTNGPPKFEPGNFAIEKTVSDDVWPEIMIQLWSKLNRSKNPEKPNHYLTYADEYSLKLYAALGFKPIPREKIQALDGTVVLPSGRILKDRIEWTPMEASQETMDRLLELHVSRLRRRGRSNDEIESLLQRRPETNTTSRMPRTHFWGTGVRNSEKVHAFLRVEHTQFDTITFSFQDSQMQWHQSLGMIAANSLPLKEGAVIQSGGRGDAGVDISYRNGILRIENASPSFPGVAEIETSADLKSISSARYRSRDKTIEVKF